MAIREVRVGLELNYGVAAADAASNYFFMRVNDLQPKNVAPLEKPRETSGTTIPLQRARLKGRQFDFTIKTYGYHDLTTIFMLLAFGMPTTTSPALAGKIHTFKPGGTALKSATIQWKQVGSQGIMWFQSTGCEIKTVKCTIMANGMLMWEFSGHGHYATNIPTPLAQSDTTAAYVQPIDMTQQTITHGGSAFVDPIKKFDITVDNGLVPDWSIPAITPSRDFSRLKLGDTVATAAVEALFDVYTGSMTSKEDTGFSTMNQIVYTAQDVSTIIPPTTGSGKPTTTITIPKPYVDAVTQDNTVTDPEEKGTLDFGYNSALASLMKFEFQNELDPAVAFLGH